MVYEREKAPLYKAASPSVPMQYFVQAIRVSHPTPIRLKLEPFNSEGASLGVFQLGPEHGWICRDGVFVSESAGRYGGSDFAPVHDISSIRQITRAEDGALVISARSSTQEVSTLLLGARLGVPEIRTSEERYSAVRKR